MEFNILPSQRKRHYGFLKSNEAWITAWLTDLIVVPCIPVLCRLNKIFPLINPNTISVAGFITYFGSLVSFFIFPDKWWLWTGGFFISLVFDDMDGKFARALGQKSSMGTFVDALVGLFCHGLGLMILGIGIASKTGYWDVLVAMWIYAIFVTGLGVQTIKELVEPSKEAEILSSGKPKTSWQLWCDRNGLVYNFFTDAEVVYICILFIGINLADPRFIIIGSISIRFLTCIWQGIKGGVFGK